MLPPDRLDGGSPRIVNGTLTSSYPTTGALLTPGNASTGSLYCSGTLIGCQTFLTAAHCVCDTVGANCQGTHAPNPAAFIVFLQHAGFFAVSSITVRSDFDFPVGDVAVIKLAQPVTGIAPTAIDTTGAPVSGTTGMIAGFGRSGGGGLNADYGLKRVGKVITATCAPNPSDATSVCWNFAEPQGAPGTNSNTCNGDSGGPLFIDFGAGDRLAGSTSGGTSNTCLPNDHSYDANIFTYASWIQTQGGADLANQTCGTIPQIGQPGANVVAATGTLSSGSPQGTHTFEVAPGTELLRVAMNAIDDGPSDFDLYVRAGAEPTTSIFDCAAAGANQFGFCEFPNPTPGTWYVLVNRFAGAGQYQLTVSTFGMDCAAPGTDGASCDDGNACTTTDVCQAGACVGTPANGAACDDGDLCTVNDTCTNGACVGSTEPASGCRLMVPPARSVFQLTERPVDTQDRLQWRWRHGSVTPRADFGDPVNGNTSYALCVYDASPSVIMRAAIPAGGFCNARRPRPCWKSTSKGFQYTDKDLTPDGIQSMTLREGLLPGKASILVKGKGPLLDMAAVPIASLPVVVQLKNSDGQCWQATHGPAVISNDARGFRSKGN